jgi:hypothetical protein
MTADITHKADLRILQGQLLEAAKQIATSLRRIDFLLDQTEPDASTQTTEQDSLPAYTGIHREPTLPKTPSPTFIF